MKTPRMTPPRLARWLLSRALPRDQRAVVIADLDEEFAARGTRRWYWRQVGASLPSAIRLRSRSHGRNIMGDLSYGLRLLRRYPAMSAAATITLALGIAATSAAVTIANAVLVRKLPYHDPDRVVSLAEYDRTRDAASGNVSWPDFVDYREQSRTLEHLAGYNGGSRTLQAGDQADRVPIASVTPEFFAALGVSALRGRTFAAADVNPGAPLVTVITHGCWQLRFGGDPSIVGRVITLNAAAVEVVGVLPADFEFPPRGLAELWLPLRPSQAQLERRYYHWMDVIARLKPGATVEQASSELDAIARGFAAQDPRAHATTAARVVRLQDRIVRDARPSLLMLSGAALLVLLVACANLACLLLARGQGRGGEMGMRAAIGASRSRLARQVMAENLVLALPGGILGVVAGQWLVRLFVANLPRTQRASLPHLQQLGLDLPTVAISVALVAGSVLLFGILPAVRTSRTAVINSRGVAGPGHRDLRLQGAFIASQVALALVLLFGAGLMGQSVRRLLDVSPGFRTSGLLTATFNTSGPRYQTPESVAALHSQALAAISALPGVQGVSSIDQLPLTGRNNSGSFNVVGDPARRETTVLIRTVAANYFDVMGLPLLAGRGFQSGDRPGSTRVALVNQLLAEKAFGGQPIGQRVTFPFTGPEPFEIVGVVGNEQFDRLDQPLSPVLYSPFDQGPPGGMSFVMRTTGDPSIVPSLRAAVARLDPGLPVYQIVTMDQILGLSDAVFRRRSVLMLMAGFAGAALLLAAVGLYGVLAQIVATRTREIGIRLALGASTTTIVAAVLRPGIQAVGAGLVVGVAGCLLAGRLLGSLLFRTPSADPSALAMVVGLLVLAALAAAVAPSRRALAVDPVESLRE